MIVDRNDGRIAVGSRFSVRFDRNTEVARGCCCRIDNLFERGRGLRDANMSMFIGLVHNTFLGSDPDRGQSPVEWGDFWAAAPIGDEVL